jgi:hypothetical protein
MELKQTISEIENVSNDIAYYEQSLNPLVEKRENLLTTFKETLENAMEKNEIVFTEPKVQIRIGYSHVLLLNVNLLRKKVDLIKVETLKNISELFQKTSETE